MSSEALYVEQLNTTYNKHLQRRNMRIWELEVLNDALGEQVQKLMDERDALYKRIADLEQADEKKNQASND